MVRVDLNIPNEQKAFLISLNTLTLSEHLRRAITDYINKLKIYNASTSLSQGLETVEGEL